MFRFLSWIDRLNQAAGHLAGWFLLAMVLIQLLVVLLRYVFNIGFLWMQESVLYLHVGLALLTAGFALLHNAHVRVDIFYKEVPVRMRAAVDMVGAIIFLLPLCFVVFWESLPFVTASWTVLEGSSQPSGLPGVFLLKTAILGFAALLGLQGVACAIRAFLNLTARPQDVRNAFVDMSRS